MMDKYPKNFHIDLKEQQIERLRAEIVFSDLESASLEHQMKMIRMKLKQLGATRKISLRRLTELCKDYDGMVLPKEGA
ncbi:MAG: hypothetical protein O9264_13935 [Leptospira sp.]|nr:hypothetical protein [Leptospira sp.]